MARFRKRFRGRRGFRKRGRFARKKKMKRFSRLLTRVGRPKAELKHHFLSFEANTVSATRVDVSLWDLIQKGIQGSAPQTVPGFTNASKSANRIGDKIFVEYVYFNLGIYHDLTEAMQTAHGQDPAICRLRCLKWQGYQSVAATFDDVLGAQDGLTGPEAAVFSRTNTIGANCKLKFDKRFTLAPPISLHPGFVPATGYPVFYTGTGNNPYIKWFRKKMKVRKVIVFQDIPGDAVAVNPDYTFHWQSDLDADRAPLMWGYISIAFRDA